MSAILATSPSDSASIILSWRPGTSVKRLLNIRKLRRCLRRNFKLERYRSRILGTYSVLKDSSGSSARSPMRRRPFVMMEFTLHNACTVRPKCRPWWTSGSEMHLWVNIRVIGTRANDADQRFFSRPQFKGIVSEPPAEDCRCWWGYRRGRHGRGWDSEGGKSRSCNKCCHERCSSQWIKSYWVIRDISQLPNETRLTSVRCYYILSHLSSWEICVLLAGVLKHRRRPLH